MIIEKIGINFMKINKGLLGCDKVFLCYFTKSKLLKKEGLKC